MQLDTFNKGYCLVRQLVRHLGVEIYIKTLVMKIQTKVEFSQIYEMFPFHVDYN